MTDNHARARETSRLARSAADQALAIRWIDEELAVRAADDVNDGRGLRQYAGPHSTETDLFTREFVVEAYLAGREQSWLIAVLGRATALMADAVALFRTYEGHHIAKAEDEARPPEERAASHKKAERNREIAERLEAFLMNPDVPRDRVSSLALSLVQDLGELMADSGGVYGLHQNGDPAPWESLTAGGRFQDWLSSYDRLRDELDRVAPPERGDDRQERPRRIGESPSEVRARVDQAIELSEHDTFRLEAAACLWEAVLDLRLEGSLRLPPESLGSAVNPDARPLARAVVEWLEGNGFGDVRLTVVGWTDELVAAWKAADPDAYDGCFDWDFVPEWLGAKLRGVLTVDPDPTPGRMTPAEVEAQEAFVSAQLDAGIAEVREADEPGFVPAVPGEGYGIGNVKPVEVGPLADPAVVEGLMEVAGLAEQGKRPALGLEQRVQTGDPRFDPLRPATINGYRFVPAQALGEALAMLASSATVGPEGFTAGERAQYERLHALAHGAPATEG